MDRVTLSRAALDPEVIRRNFERLQDEVAAACRRAGRDASQVDILTATKYVSADGMAVLADAGIRLIGENRGQELIAKHEIYGDRFTWDFIGRLQSNKVRQVLPLVRLIHSVETLSVVKELDQRVESPINVLLQVNIGVEASKYGIIPSEVDRFLEEAERYSQVNFTGLMTMPPLVADPEAARSAFSAMRELAARLSHDWQGRYRFQQLSMGTSNDFIAAVEEGSTIIRIGSTIYQQENKS